MGKGNGAVRHTRAHVRQAAPCPDGILLPDKGLALPRHVHAPGDQVAPYLAAVPEPVVGDGVTKPQKDCERQAQQVEGEGVDVNRRQRAQLESEQLGRQQRDGRTPYAKNVLIKNHDGGGQQDIKNKLSVYSLQDRPAQYKEHLKRARLVSDDHYHSLGGVKKINVTNPPAPR